MFGFDMSDNTGGFGMFINSETSLMPLAYQLIALPTVGFHSDLNLTTVTQRFPYPCNMFATEYVTIKTSLNTNTWDANGKGKSNILLEYQLDRSPLESSTPWEQQNVQALH